MANWPEDYCSYCDYLKEHCHCPLIRDPNWCQERCYVSCWQGCPSYGQNKKADSDGT